MKKKDLDTVIELAAAQCGCDRANIKPMLKYWEGLKPLQPAGAAILQRLEAVNAIAQAVEASTNVTIDDAEETLLAMLTNLDKYELSKSVRFYGSISDFTGDLLDVIRTRFEKAMIEKKR